jgi:uncharacterized Zn finger protein
MIDLQALALRLAGQNAFEKGLALNVDGAVENLVVKLPKITASVEASSLFQVELTFAGETIDGNCNCPASEGFDFCRHCVAVLLSYDEYNKTFEKLRDGEPSLRLKAYIEGLGEKELKTELYTLLSQSPDLFEHWVLLADLSSKKIQAGDLKKQITKALPLRNIWRNEKVRDYFLKASKTLIRLFSAIETVDVNTQFEFCEAALARYDKILERIDDANGSRFGVFSLLEKRYALAFSQLSMPTSEKAEYLLTLFDAPYNHIEFTGLPHRFIQDDGALQLAFFRLLKQWVDKHIRSNAKKKISTTIALKRRTRTLIEYLSSQLDYKSALYYYTKIANSLDDYFSIVELAISAHEYAIASEYLELIKQQSKNKADALTVAQFALKVSQAKDDYSAALTDAWSIFEITHNIQDIEVIQNLASTLDIEVSEIQLKAEKVLLKHIRMGGFAKSSGEHLRTIETLAELYLLSGFTDKALALSQQYELPHDTLHEIAHASLSVRPKASFNLYRQLCLLYPQLGSGNDYESCLELLRELDDELPHSEGLSERFNHLLAELFDIFQHKEAFIVLLQKQFPNTRN